MISYAEAIATVLQHAGTLPVEVIPLEVAHGRILAEPVISRCPLPPFDQAGVEGYALHCGDDELPVGTEVPLMAAGQKSRERSGHGLHGLARRVAVNHAVPPGLDAVLPLEWGQRLPPGEDGVPRLRLKAPLRAGAHVRRIGSEAPSGTDILAAGTVLDAPRILLAASVGAGRLQVVARPQVAIFTSGHPHPTGMDGYHAVSSFRDVNGSYLEMMSRTMGADVRLNQPLGSCPEYLEAMLQQARDMGMDMIVCTRIETATRHERMMAVLRSLEARILFHTVAFNPGTSLICAQFPSGALFFGMSADPAAMAAAYRFFVIPALGRMQGRAVEKPVWALLEPPLHPRGKLPSFRRARLYQDRDGGLRAHVPRSDDPYSIQQVGKTNAWVLIQPHAASWHGETRLEVYGTLPDMLDIPVEHAMPAGE
ncbi:molybdopterin-binding domain-containing protein [Frateuria aurantia]